MGEAQRQRRPRSSADHTAASYRPSTPSPTVAYSMRNLIERTFCRLKDWRAIATRYDNTARNFLAGICLALAITSMDQLSPEPNLQLGPLIEGRSVGWRVVMRRSAPR